jgi:hypothetical protein
MERVRLVPTRSLPMKPLLLFPLLRPTLPPLRVFLTALAKKTGVREDRPSARRLSALVKNIAGQRLSNQFMEGRPLHLVVSLLTIFVSNLTTFGGIMWQATHSLVVRDLNKASVWTAWTDVNHWNDWDKDLEYATLDCEFNKRRALQPA